MNLFKTYKLGPIVSYGYVCLLNGSTKPNCKAETVVIGGKLRVIIYTSRKIKKD